MPGSNETDVVSTWNLTIATILNGGRERGQAFEKESFPASRKSPAKKIFPWTRVFKLSTDSFRLNYFHHLSSSKSR